MKTCVAKLPTVCGKDLLRPLAASSGLPEAGIIPLSQSHFSDVLQSYFLYLIRRRQVHYALEDRFNMLRSKDKAAGHERLKSHAQMSCRRRHSPLFLALQARRQPSTLPNAGKVVYTMNTCQHAVGSSILQKQHALEGLNGTLTLPAINVAQSLRLQRGWLPVRGVQS